MITAVRGQSTNALWLARACPKAGTLLSSTPVQIASFLAFSAATGAWSSLKSFDCFDWKNLFISPPKISC